jgi:hypothetical protein
MKKYFFFFLCFFAFIFFLPNLASTSLGQKLTLQLIGWKTNSRFSASSMHLTWFGPQAFHHLKVTNQKINASCENFIALMPIWQLISGLQGPFTISKGYARFYSASCNHISLEDVEAEVEGRQFTASGSTKDTNQSGSFKIAGRFNTFPGDCDLEGHLTSLPSCLLDQLLQTNRLIEELIGASLSLKGSVSAQNGKGSFNLTLDSSNCQTQANGSFNGHTITLQKSLIARILPTPALSELLMKGVNPLFLTSVQAHHPITLKLSAENFSCPYAPFDISSLTIEQGVVDIGQVTIQNGPSLQALLDLLRNRRLQNIKDMNAWFTPLSFQLKNGNLTADRLDVLLAGSVHLCSWGRINLQNKKLHMYLGIPSATLASSFGVSGLNSDYVLKIPVRGTITQPELITGPAIAQITTISASQNLPLPKVGKLFGKVIQGVAELKSDKDVPPAKHPFPWER